MGNTFTLQQNEERKDMHSTEATLKELNRRVHLVDTAITGLARAIDALQSMSLQFGGTETPRIAESILIGESDVQSLQSLVESIFNNKTVTVKEVREFLNFMLDLGKKFIEGELNYSTQLAVNSYFPPVDIKHTQYDCITEYYNARIEYLEMEKKLLKDINELQRQEIEQLCKRKQTYLDENEWIINKTEANEVPLDLASSERQLENPLSNMHIEKNERDPKLQIKIDDEVPGRTLSKSCEIIETNNLYFEERPHAFRTQRENDGKDITVVITEDTEFIRLNNKHSKPNVICSQTDDKLRIVSQGKGYLESINLSLKQTTDALETEKIEGVALMKVHQEVHEQLNMKKTVYVQVYNSPAISARQTAEALMQIVRTKLASSGTDMQVIELKNPLKVDVSMPLLIYCEPRYLYAGMKYSVETTLKKFNGVRKNMAVLFFHDKDELRLRREIERMGRIDTGSLGGIFQIGHRISMQDSKINDASVHSIVNLIVTN